MLYMFSRVYIYIYSFTVSIHDVYVFGCEDLYVNFHSPAHHVVAVRLTGAGNTWCRHINNDNNNNQHHNMYIPYHFGLVVHSTRAICMSHTVLYVYRWVHVAGRKGAHICSVSVL